MSLLRSIPEVAGPAYYRGIASFRRIFRSSEAALIILSISVGLGAGLLMIVQHAAAHGMQAMIYGLSGASLSAASAIDTPRFLALPIFGLLLGLASRAAVRRWRTPVDVVEANALHGGVIPLRDSLLVCAQTIVSNGAGPSVGLEAAYAQAGGGLASVLGRWLRLRRADMRILVGLRPHNPACASKPRLPPSLEQSSKLFGSSLVFRILPTSWIGSAPRLRLSCREVRT